jgi:UDP-GlcNAc:undecaprenyl-phosphate GlcNAc-1-phosphate transferase
LATNIGTYLLSLGLSAIFCAVFRRYGGRFGYVANPEQDRWHRTATPLGGGIAIYLSFLIVISLTFGIGSLSQQPYMALLISASGIFLLGLLDDFRKFRPQTKLLWQILAASFFISFGFSLQLTPWNTLNFFLTLFWIVGIMNAFNLLDNMDGMAAGIALIALFFRFLIFVIDGNAQSSILCLIMMGALMGFLFFNFPRASIFMGDAGSLFIGFFTSTVVMTGGYPYTKAVVSVLLLPVLILLIPIFDTALVTISRMLSRRPIYLGGKDHLSHRLVAVGLSERKAVLLMYSISIISGSIAFVLYQTGFSYTVMGASLLVLGCVCLGVYLSKVKVYPEHEMGMNGQTDLFTLIKDFQYKRQVAAMIGDVILISAAYYSSYLLRFGEISRASLQHYAKTLPLIIVCQVLCHYAAGLYRSSWRYASVPDLIAILKAIIAGTLATGLLSRYLYGHPGYSVIPLFIIYGMSLLLLTAGFRLSFRLLDELLTGENQNDKKILIYGAGDGGELLAREVIRNRALRMIPMGFIDDDPKKQKQEILGIPVLGNLQCLEKQLSINKISEIIISTEKLDSEVYQALLGITGRFGVTVKKMKLTVQ